MKAKARMEAATQRKVAIDVRDFHFETGANCWRTTTAAQAAFLVDGEAYFAAFHEALGRARHQVLVLAWDIDSQVALLRGERASGHPCVSLVERLSEVLDAEPGLRIYLLDWDFSVIYTFEREWVPVFRLPWRRRRRLAFESDGELPAGASHHQKVVVIDDAVAFSGGLDLTHSRWDTSEHRPSHPERRRNDGMPYGPFHDVQALIAGETAAALGELARQRWHRATGTKIKPPPPAAWAERWPAGVEPVLDDVPVAIARTIAPFAGFPGRREVVTAFLDQVRAARRYLYFESQYLTSDAVVTALCGRLQEEDGPEVVIIVPREASGWLEERTMGEGRDRSASRLRESDAHGRLRILCPMTSGRGNERSFVNVHAKVLIVDDRWIRIGSANLSNRSMMLDTECDLIFDTDGRDGAARALLARLLGEHSGRGTEAASRALAQGDGLLAAIDALLEDDGRLEPLPEQDTGQLRSPVLGIADPERPLEPEAFIRLFGGGGDPSFDRKAGWLRLLLVLVLLAGLAIAWRTTPVSEWLSAATLTDLQRQAGEAGWMPAAAVLAFPLASLAVAPVTLLIALAAVVFGPYEGFLVSAAGVFLAAVLNYGIGAFLGRSAVRRMAGPRVNRISRRLARQGIVAVAAIRMVPVAPFTVVNVVAGASHIRLRDYLLGTLLGMGPGMAALAWLAGNAGKLAGSPDLREVSLFLAGLGLLLGAVVGLRMWLGRRAE
jgi:phosphatidylserine/phosphatidylglycerophosphate/cardiolipin synthase-like enzyme/uncharacterized membrane protein YdjX (TVP38/TMEM64 family)